MSASLIGLVSVALSLSGFGVDKNPNAPTGTTVVSYAPDRADLMVYFDAEAVVPRNYRALKNLANDPALNKLPDLKRELTSAIGQLEMGLGMIRGMVKMDPVADIKSAALWVQFPRRGEPRILIHVRGNFPKDLLSTIANTSKQPTLRIGGRTAIEVDRNILLASAPDGSLLFGTKDLVRRRAKRGARRRAPRRGSAGARAITMLDRKPFFAVVSSPSGTALRRLQKEMGRKDNALADLISGHRFAGFAMHSNGVEWTYVARTRAGVARAEMASKGLLQLMRASHLAGRGLANLFFSAIDSYRGKDRDLDLIIQVKPDLLKLIDEFTGDGKFRQRIRVDRRAKTVRVTANGRSLSDVMPFAGALPLAMGAGYFMLGVAAPSMAPAPARAMPKPERRYKKKRSKKRRYRKKGRKAKHSQEEEEDPLGGGL